MKKQIYIDQEFADKVKALDELEKWSEKHPDLCFTIMCYYVGAFDDLLDTNDLYERIEYYTDEIAESKKVQFDINRQRTLMDEILP